MTFQLIQATVKRLEKNIAALTEDATLTGYNIPSDLNNEINKKLAEVLKLLQEVDEDVIDQLHNPTSSR